MYTKTQQCSIFLLLLFYGAGFIGISIPASRSLFLMATPLTLLLSTIILLWNHQGWNRSFLFFCFLAFTTGLGVEILGVATGAIFGTYHYGTVLGASFMDVPLIIGVNWLLCIYCSGAVAYVFIERVKQWTHWQSKPPSNYWVNGITMCLGATLMVLLDLVLEPVAIQLTFWYWPNDVVPIQNYIAWFFISLLLMIAFFTLPFSKKNPVALILYPILIVFFGLLSLIK